MIADRESMERCQKDNSIVKIREMLTSHPSLQYFRLSKPQCAPTKATKFYILLPNHHPLAQYLGQLLRTLFRIIRDDKDFTHPLVVQHVSPSFSGSQDGRASSYTRDEHFKIWAKASDEMPNYNEEIVETNTEIYSSGKKARLWFFKRQQGWSIPSYQHRGPGICKESVGVMKLHLQGKTWVCMRLKKMNGVSGLA